MPQVQILPFHWCHVLAADLREQERDHFTLIPDYLERLKAQTASATGFTAFDGDTIVCCWGFVPLWPGAWEAWLLPTFHVERRAMVFIRAAMRTIDAVCSRDDFRRLQMVVKCSDLRAVRFACGLRFAIEGVMKSYGPDGSDYFMMARVDDGFDVRRRIEQGGGAAGRHPAAADGDPAAAAGPDRPAGG